MNTTEYYYCDLEGQQPDPTTLYDINQYSFDFGANNITTHYVKDFSSDDYALITDSQDISATLSHIGLSDNDFGFLLVKAVEGDFVEIYGSEYAVPACNYEVTKLL